MSTKIETSSESLRSFHKLSHGKHNKVSLAGNKDEMEVFIATDYRKDINSGA